ncbi:hypothetical protein [Nocardioides sp.]|uniref:hypothetical protein n=1 Tax=Nocardioides sp. TaxID=35761 RepID=UPI002ED537C2
MSAREHAHDVENPHAGQGMVLLDIGGDVGALVVQMPRELLDQEVEIWQDGPRPTETHLPHVAVVDRPVERGSVPSLVFPHLPAGRYRLAPKGSPRARLVVDVRGAEVTEAAWPTRLPR